MGDFFIHILKSSVCLTLMYLFYRLLMSKETFHRFNRVILLSILILSSLIPFIRLTVTESVEVQNAISSIEYVFVQSSEIYTETQQEMEILSDEKAPPWPQVVLLVYLIGILFFFCRHIYSFIHMLIALRHSKCEKIDNHIKLIIHNKEIAPFSWMKYIVISKKDLTENSREILIHEKAHIDKYHSWDLLIADICIILQWFNPAAWLTKQELQNIHEYEADETVIKEGINAKQYQLLLIKKAVGKRLYSMANSFNHSKLKKRITMMSKKKSNRWAQLKYLYILPVIAVSITAFARPEISDELIEISNVKVNDLTEMMKTKTADIFETVNPAVDKQEMKKYRTDSLVNVAGIIRDADRNALEGVAIKVKDFPKGSITNSDGKFSLSEIPINSQLSIHYKGATTTLNAIASKMDITINHIENENSESAKIRLGTITMENVYPFSIDKNNLPTKMTGKMSMTYYSTSDSLTFNPSEEMTLYGDAIIYEDPETLKLAITDSLKGRVVKLSQHILTQDSAKYINLNGGSKASIIVTTSKIGNENTKIEGTVKGINGKPLVGEKLEVPGTNIIVTTDKDGKFSFETPKDQISIKHKDMVLNIPMNKGKGVTMRNSITSNKNSISTVSNATRYSGTQIIHTDDSDNNSDFHISSSTNTQKESQNGKFTIKTNNWQMEVNSTSKKNNENDEGNTSLDIKGKITDENENPIVGEEITIEGTSLRTTTDENGNFIFKKVTEKEPSVIKYKGWNINVTPKAISATRDKE